MRLEIMESDFRGLTCKLTSNIQLQLEPAARDKGPNQGKGYRYVEYWLPARWGLDGGLPSKGAKLRQK